MKNPLQSGQSQKKKKKREEQEGGRPRRRFGTRGKGRVRPRKNPELEGRGRTSWWQKPRKLLTEKKGLKESAAWQSKTARGGGKIVRFA